MADVSTPEAAVRDYLTFLADPDSLVDAAVVAQIEAELVRAEDPIDRLMVMAKLHKAKATDPDVYENAFIAHAKEWADAENIPVSAFEQLGVPLDVLERAGFFGKLIRKVGRGIGRAARPVGPIANRRTAIRSDALEAGILAFSEPFTVKDVSRKVGGSAITVKSAIDRLEAQSKVTPAGMRPNARGRASKVWVVRG